MILCVPGKMMPTAPLLTRIWRIPCQIILQVISAMPSFLRSVAADILPTRRPSVLQEQMQLEPDSGATILFLASATLPLAHLLSRQLPFLACSGLLAVPPPRCAGPLHKKSAPVFATFLTSPENHLTRGDFP